MEQDAQRSGELAFRILGAATGIVVFVSLAGGAVTAARLHALGLPTDSTIAALPREQILISGVRVLSGGLIAGLFVIAVLWLLNETRMLSASPTKDARALVAVPVLTLAPLLVYTLLQPLTTTMLVVVSAVTIITAAVLVLVLSRPSGFGPLSWRFFAVVAVFGGVLAFARAYSPPVTLDFTDVQLKDGARTTGFLLGQSSDAVVLAPEVLKKTIGRTVVIQRDQVLNLLISRVRQPVRPIGPEPVSQFTVDVKDPDERKLERTILQIKLSAQWKYPPLVYHDSVLAWRKNFDAFTRSGDISTKSEVQETTLEDLTEQTPLFAGKLVLLRARIVEATPWDQHRPQRIVFRAPDSDRYLGTCDVWTTQNAFLRPNDNKWIRGLVIASGIFVSGAGTKRSRIAMVCAPPR